MTAILDDVVTKKKKTDGTTARITKAEKQLSEEQIALQVSRQKFYEIIGPYPFRWTKKGPFAKAITGTDLTYWTFMYLVACVLLYIVAQLVGMFALFFLVPVAFFVWSEMRHKIARYTKWANHRE